MGKDKRALFIGRWQPFHKGHVWLIDQKLLKGVPVLIAVRDIEPDESNPLTTKQTIEIIETLYKDDKRVSVISIPDIESVNYGRGVGYEVNEFTPPDSIYNISATEIRTKIKNGDDSWKLDIPSNIRELTKKYLKDE